MSNTLSIQQRDYGQGLYLLPFVIFTILLMARNSESYGHIFNLIPVLGRTIPYFCLSVLLVCVYKYRGGSLAQLGMCWPKSKTVMWVVLWAIVILALRVFVAIAAEPLLELLPPKLSRTNPLVGDVTLLFNLLPVMWLVVIGEEVLFRGLLMNYLAKLFGDTTTAWLIAILISALLFGLGHIGKDPAAMLGSGLGGLAYGLGYFLARKNHGQ
jgi:membrane protease YdiL (CAAX protease family)